jgi:type II secretory pathway pseudopilin PulG
MERIGLAGGAAVNLPNERGFSLIETMFAMGILATALLSLAAVFALGLNHLAGSSASLIAREKAREAVESVHTARDTRVITWAQIANVDRGGVFLVGAQPLRTAGADGIVNTADDGALEQSLEAGADNVLGTADDVRTPLAGYTRQIEILDLVDAGGTVNANLRELRVTIGFRVGGSPRTYVLTTYISSIS